MRRIINKGKNHSTYEYTAYLAFLWDQVQVLNCPPSGSALLSHRLSQISSKYTVSIKGATAQWRLQEAASKSLLSDPLICVSWTASTAVAEPSPRQSKQQRGIPNLSQLQHRTAGCCLPSKTGASFGMLSLILRKKAWLLSPRQWQQQSSSSSRKPRDICKERSSFNRKWNTHFFHDRTGHTRVF